VLCSSEEVGIRVYRVPSFKATGGGGGRFATP
jgi:hypothetical protein